MTNRKAVFGIMAVLACTAVILWSIDTYVRPGYQCGTDSMRVALRTHEVLVKYYPLIMRLPHNPAPEPKFLIDENGDETDTWGIVILTNEEINQDILHSEDRIPVSLESVPMQILPRAIGGKYRSGSSGYDLKTSNPHWYFHLGVMSKNLDLIQRYPFYTGHTWFVADHGKDPSNNYTLDEIVGTRVYVTKKIDPSTLAPEGRIPECLEDVPVRISLDPS